MDISREDREITFQASKSLLFDKNKPWTKKGDSNFDIGMGSFHGAECCELVGLFLLSLLQDLKLILGLYRDDGLGVCSLTARQIELTKKEMCEIFKQQGLSITIEAKHKVVDILDVNLDIMFRPEGASLNDRRELYATCRHRLKPLLINT